MSGIFRHLLQGGGEDLVDLVKQDRWWAARPGLVEEPLQPPVDEPGPPLGDRLLTDPQFGGDLGVR